jgi:hypothetical protein
MSTVLVIPVTNGPMANKKNVQFRQLWRGHYSQVILPQKSRQLCNADNKRRRQDDRVNENRTRLGIGIGNEAD